MTQHGKILNVLHAGKRLSVTRAEKMGIVNLSARVAELRAQGHSIFTNQRKDTGSFYQIGRPSRSMVASAYALAGSSLFGGN